MTIFEPNTEGHFCSSCESYRVRTVGHRCPVCIGEERDREEKAAQEPLPTPRTPGWTRAQVGGAA